MEYKLIRSTRRTLAVQIKPDKTVIVRAPLNMPQSRIDAFLSERALWIEKHLIKTRSAENLPKYGKEEIQTFVAEAKRVLPAKIARFAAIIGVSYGKITVRVQRTVWGSCSFRGNLNFNCLLVNLPQAVTDYVIIHELCHLKQMNHSRKFWNCVEKYCSEYKTYRKWLKTHGEEFLRRL